MKRVVITGATGAIGTALIQELTSRGIEVLVLCRKDSARNKDIPQSAGVTCQYCALDELKGFQNETGKQYDVFFHFAWAGTTGAARNDMFMQNQNVEYALDAVRAAHALGCHTFIGAGSQAEYGRVDAPLAADTPAFPENGYGMAKLCAGQMTRVYAQSLGMRHLWVRILSVYGNLNTSDLIAYLIGALREGRAIECTKGEQIWDFLYKKDAASALRLIAEKGIDGKTYVLGSGDGRALREYIEAVKNIVRPSAQIAYGARPYAEKEVMHLVADLRGLAADTGWKPAYTFEEGIRDMLK